MKHFLFLRTAVGQGIFFLFCASMFLVGNNDELWGYIMTGVMGFMGILYILIGCSCVKTHQAPLERNKAGEAASSDKAGLLNTKEEYA